MAFFICGVLSSFCLFFLFCVCASLSAVVPVILQVVEFLVVGFLAANLHWSVEFPIEFLGWNLWLSVYMGDLK